MRGLLQLPDGVKASRGDRVSVARQQLLQVEIPGHLLQHPPGILRQGVTGDRLCLENPGHDGSYSLSKCLDQSLSVVVVAECVLAIVIVFKQVQKESKNFRWTDAVGIPQTRHSNWDVTLEEVVL